MSLVHYSRPNVVNGLCDRQKIPVSTILAFNDPFELHFVKGSPPTAQQAADHLERLYRDDRSGIEDALKNLGKDPSTFWASRADPLTAHRLAEEAFGNTVFALQNHGKQIFDNHYKLLCCVNSERTMQNEELMWAHYAASHTGVRLHFTEQFYAQDGVVAHPMEYHAHPPVYNFSDLENPQNFLDKTVASKSDRWILEQEERIYIPNPILFYEPKAVTKPAGHENPLRPFVGIRPGDISRIDFGMRFNDSSSAVATIRKKFPNIEFFQCAAELDSYRLRYFPL